MEFITITLSTLNLKDFQTFFGERLKGHKGENVVNMMRLIKKNLTFLAVMKHSGQTVSTNFYRTFIQLLVNDIKMDKWK